MAWSWMLFYLFQFLILPLNIGQWCPRREAATILLIAINSKMIWSVFIHQSSCPTALLKTLCFRGRLKKLARIFSRLKFLNLIFGFSKKKNHSKKSHVSEKTLLLTVFGSCLVFPNYASEPAVAILGSDSSKLQASFGASCHAKDCWLRHTDKNSTYFWNYIYLVQVHLLIALWDQSTVMLGGPHSTVDSVLASCPAAPGLILGVPKIFSSYTTSTEMTVHQMTLDERSSNEFFGGDNSIELDRLG